jgi:hypothetical protein
MEVVGYIRGRVWRLMRSREEGRWVVKMEMKGIFGEYCRLRTGNEFLQGGLLDVTDAFRWVFRVPVDSEVDHFIPDVLIRNLLISICCILWLQE